VNYLFSLVTIFLIGRNGAFDSPRPVDTCSGCMEYDYALENWHAVQAAKAEMQYFHVSFCAYFRMAFFSSDGMVVIMDAQFWSIAYYLIYVYVVKLCIMMAFYSILQDKIMKDVDEEKFTLAVDDMVLSINKMLKNIIKGIDGADSEEVKALEKKASILQIGKQVKALKTHHLTRTITKKNFCDGYHYSPQFKAMQKFLKLSDADFPHIFDIVDLDGSGDLSVSELVNMFRLMKFMVADSAVAVRIQNSELQKQRLYIMENYFKTKQVATV
jgi:hypothetical protein